MKNTAKVSDMKLNMAIRAKKAFQAFGPDQAFNEAAHFPLGWEALSWLLELDAQRTLSPGSQCEEVERAGALQAGSSVLPALKVALWGCDPSLPSLTSCPRMGASPPPPPHIWDNSLLSF